MNKEKELIKTEAEIKNTISLQECNNCEPEDIAKIIAEFQSESGIEIEVRDGRGKYWQNKGDTLIFAADARKEIKEILGERIKNKKAFEEVKRLIKVELEELGNDIFADEIMIQEESDEGEWLVRFWWD